MDRYDKNEGIHSVIRFKRQQQFSAEVEKQFSALLDRNLIEVIHKNRFRGGRPKLRTNHLWVILHSERESGFFWHITLEILRKCNSPITIISIFGRNYREKLESASQNHNFSLFAQMSRYLKTYYRDHEIFKDPS